jgi:phospho-N-acetylmuramoyl-pentapeptide-transferase
LFLIGLGVSLVFAPVVIKMVRQLKAGQNILEYVDTHIAKQGTPTMGGIIFLLGLIVCFFAILDNNSRFCSITILVTFAYAILGFLDDFLKIKFKHNEGLKAYQKALGQVGIAIIMALFVYNSGLVGNTILIPFGFGEINLGWGIIPFIVVFYLAVTNSVNLTDGLDGLAGGVSCIFLMGFILIMSIAFNNNLLNYSELFNAEISNLLLLCAGFVGSIVAFLVHNWFPAKIFMGDTGSLAIGGFVATILTLSQMYLFVFMAGIMFVVNTLSVVIQVGYFKLTKKRVFKMAPLHHHFERCGISETRIVFSYIVITVVGVAVAMLIYL